jgi:hypothetical protein
MTVSLLAGACQPPSREVDIWTAKPGPATFETDAPYPYRVLGSELFEVCATFATECSNGHRSCADWYGQQDSRIEGHAPEEECFRLAPVEAR